MKKRFRYIEDRISYFLILLAVTAILSLVLLLHFSHETGHLRGAVMITGVLYAFLVISGIRRIWLPLRRFDRGTELFLSGYTAEGIRNPEASVSRATDQLIRKVVDMLTSDEVLKMNKRQAQYLALQNQINPHFLYNTLESIRSEAMEAGMTNVMKMSEALADFFRYTISKVENMVTLEEELKNVETYFYIQQYRFEDRIRLEIVFEDDRELLLKALMPKLTLQPVVENSIIHGIERKLDPGTVRISLGCTGKRLLIRISDDGVGMEPEVFAQLARRLDQPLLESVQSGNSRGGIALVNVNNRIHLLFGEEYGMALYSTKDVGTDVTISLPYLVSRRQLEGGEKVS